VLCVWVAQPDAQNPCSINEQPESPSVVAATKAKAATVRVVRSFIARLLLEMTVPILRALTAAGKPAAPR
jgi:hypothetical protein